MVPPLWQWAIPVFYLPVDNEINVGICLNSDGPLPQRWLHLPVVVLLFLFCFTHENIAIYCGELPVANCLFFVKKTKDNRTWVADQEPVNMKRLEP